MTKLPLTNSGLIDDLSALAIAAGTKALEIYEGEFEVENKNDDSPVTEADRAGEKIILEGLQQVAPQIPVLAEESASSGNIPDLGDHFFLVDPLDGTKEFINKTGEFTVNIALISKGRPVAGIVYAPAIGKIYSGVPEKGAWLEKVVNGSRTSRRSITVRQANKQAITAVASRSHRTPETDDYLQKLTVENFAAAGSSLKFCMIAEGRADIYPRFGRTMEWDTGAGQAVLEAAGGAVRTYPENAILRYGKIERCYDNPHFVAYGDLSLAQ